MTKHPKKLALWILIVSGIFALMELMVGLSIYFFPESMQEHVDLQAKGVDYIMKMWGSRQFALGFIFAFATFKKSIPMLTTAYIFLLVMFLGDLVIGISQNESTLLTSAIVMSLISVLMIYFLNKQKND